MRTLTTVILGLLLLPACSHLDHPPLVEAPYVNLERFMGDWYVIAAVPTFIDESAHNAVESYRLAADGTIATTYTFRDGGFDGPVKRYTPRGFVLDRASNSRWGMQFVWPIRADYRIAYLAPDYSLTVIAREKRDYVWIMSRTPQISAAAYQRLLKFVASQGYDLASIRRVPQRWETQQPSAEEAPR